MKSTQLLKLSAFLAAGSHVFAASTATQKAIPAEFREATGLSDAQLSQILFGSGTSTSNTPAPSSTCAEANTTVVYPHPTLPSHLDLVKRNAFVQRYA